MSMSLFKVSPGMSGDVKSEVSTHCAVKQAHYSQIVCVQIAMLMADHQPCVQKYFTCEVNE